MSYIINKHSDTSFFSKQGQKITIDKVIFEHSLVECHSVVKKIGIIYQQSASRRLSRFAVNG